MAQPGNTPGEDPSKRLEIIKTDLFHFGEFQGKKIRKLIGNVHLRQDTTDMFCDSAYHYVDSNYVIAYSNVRIILSQSLKREVEADKLTYDGVEKIVNLYDHVILKDSSVKLYTDHLTYYRVPDYGHYLNGGKIVNGENTLYSKTGYYYPKEDMTYFKKEVLLVNPDFLLETDTLGYNTKREVAYFLAPTYVYDSLNSMYTEDGFYDTKEDMAYFYQNSQVGDTSYVLYADSIIYDENADFGQAKGNVRIQESDTSLTLFAQYGEFHSKTEESVLTDRAFVIQYFDDDTLYLFADTLKSLKDSISGDKTFLAFYQANFFMNDFQGICDSITYRFDDSILHFDKEPVLWSDSTQITGESIQIGMEDNKVDTMSIPKNAFIIMEEDTVGFNQIKGKAMNAKFVDNKMERMRIFGNSESIYFTKDDEKNEYIGVNKAKCTDMVIDFEDNKPSQILFKDQPSGTFYPMFEVMNESNRLDDFVWRKSDRPAKPVWLFDILHPETDSVINRLDGMIDRLGLLEKSMDSLFGFEAGGAEPALADSNQSYLDSLKETGLDSIPLTNAAAVQNNSVLDSSSTDSLKSSRPDRKNKGDKIREETKEKRKKDKKKKDKKDPKPFRFKNIFTWFSGFFGLNSRKPQAEQTEDLADKKRLQLQEQSKKTGKKAEDKTNSPDASTENAPPSESSKGKRIRNR